MTSTDRRATEPKSKINISKAALLASVILALVLATTAQVAAAKSSQVTLVRDDRQLIENGAGPRDQALDEMTALGVDVVQVMINWNRVTSNCRTYQWSSYDAAVEGIIDRGMKPMLNPAGPAPSCGSTAKAGPLSGQQPNPKRFRTFAQAAGSHFKDVDMWGIWNEPNQGGWLIQSKFNKTLAKKIRWSPHLYRQLFLAGSKAIRSSGHNSATIFVGDTAPLGSSDLTATRPTRPVEFWREFFCLDPNYKAFRGIQRTARDCPNPFPKIRADAVAHHPYTRGGAQSPYAKGTAGDLPLAKTNALVSLLNKAAARGRIRRNVPIWFTEYGLQTRPPDFHLAVNLDQQAEYINEAEYLGYKNSRVQSYTQYELIDDPLQLQFPKSSPQRYGGFQTGLKFEDGRQKPSFDAFRLPIVVTKSGSGVSIWGAVRPKAGTTAVQIQSGSGSSFSDIGPAITITPDRRYFQKTISGSASARYRLKWQAPEGTTYYSRTAAMSRKR